MIRSGPEKPCLRVALFVSSLEGHRILVDLLEDRSASPDFDIVGVVTDDPFAPHSNAKKRLWSRLDDDEIHRRLRLVRDLCEGHGLPCYDGRVYAPPAKASARPAAEAFARRFAHDWRPDVAYMCVFGQRIPPAVFETPRFGFFNVHPSRIDRLDQWPRYGGPTPYREMREARETHFNMVLHRVDDAFDEGEAVALSALVPFNLIPGHGFAPAVREAVNAASSAVIREHLGRLLSDRAD